MARWVALLRAVNLGARNKVPMKALVAVTESLGHERVKTYLQSGNLAFDATGKEADLVAQLEDAVRTEFGVDSKVLLRKAAALDTLVADNPYAKEAAADPTKVAVHFLRAPVRAGDVPPVPEGIAEDVVVAGKHIYVSYPNGQGRTTLDDRYWRQYPKDMVSTARNWRTVLALRDLAHE